MTIRSSRRTDEMSSTLKRATTNNERERVDIVLVHSPVVGHQKQPPKLVSDVH